MPPGGSKDFVIHNMCLKKCMFLAPALNQWWWEGGMICDLIFTNKIAGRHTEVLPNFFFMLKNLVIFSTCLPIIDILYLNLLISNRLIVSNFHIVYHIILHSRPVPNYQKGAMNRL